MALKYSRKHLHVSYEPVNGREKTYTNRFKLFYVQENYLIDNKYAIFFFLFVLFLAQVHFLWSQLLFEFANFSLIFWRPIIYTYLQHY